MTKEQVCLWCHTGGPEPLESIDCERERVVVHPSHRVQLENYCRETAAGKWRFLGGIGASILLGIVAQVLVVLSSKSFGAVTAGVAVAVVAVTALKYPFATPETLALFGVRRSIMLARSGGYVALAIAVGLTAYGLTL